VPRLARAPSTEQRNLRSRGLDQLSTRELLSILNREDSRVPAAVAREIPGIARAVERIVAALEGGGRMFYVGAGTSGRLGVLDAAECPPTFGVPRSLVQGIIAGGRRAMIQAVEGAEDSSRAGAHELASHKLTRQDVVVGLTASGSTPYVRGALSYARQKGATTIAITANRQSPVSGLAEITIAPQVGPEVIAGSTRMKAGTAQKLILNMLSTAAMVRLGHTYDNWMANLTPTSRKLRRRTLAILMQITGANSYTAQHALRKSKNDLPIAVLMLMRGLDVSAARRRLRQANGNLRVALKLMTER
jgi:N-acetylmuramic acid 6-phosphate etherase